MAITYQLIQGYTLTGTQSSITFSSIPQTFTDLVVVGALRDTANVGINSPSCRINGLSTAVYGDVRGYAVGTSASSSATSSETSWSLYGADPGAAVDAGVFSNFQLYLASYRLGLPRSFNYFHTLSYNNDTLSAINMVSYRLDVSSAITDLTILSGSFATNSTLDLYGILEF